MDRLEYIMWRDTIRYKYQLDKSLQLSEQEIEEKIDELERTMSESMPYFFEGKEGDNLRIIVDHNMGFPGYNSCFIATEEDYNSWREDKGELLFCGESGCVACNNLRDQYMKCLHSMPREELRKKKMENIRLSHQFDDLLLYPLRTYQDIIFQMRTFEYYNNIDFTNLEIVKKIFRENYIYTSKEFYEQNDYLFSSNRFVLPNGQAVRLFGYERSEFGYSEDNDIDLFDE